MAMQRSTGQYVPPSPPPPAKKSRPKWQIGLVALLGLCAVCGVISSVVKPPAAQVTQNPQAAVAVAATVSVPTSTVEVVKQAEATATHQVVMAPATATDLPAKADQATMVALGASATGDYTLNAYMNNPQPARGTVVQVFGHLTKLGAPVAGAVMKTDWHFKSKSTKVSCSATTGKDGVAMCSHDISNATPGFEVFIDVALTAPDGTVVNAQTSFKPH